MRADVMVYLIPLILGVTAMVAMTASTEMEELVTLTMEERIGLDRENEWVTIGVPLPEGKVSSTEQLVLLKDGKSIDAEILPVNRWWDDGSLRWVHLIFRADCPGSGKADVSLALTQNAAPSEQIIKVTEEADGFILDTGVLKFQVRKTGFNVIDAAEMDGEAILLSHKRGLGVQVDDEEYLAALDPEVQVELEEVGPLHAVLHATGSLRNESGHRKFDFDCRIYAYAGSPNVRVVVTLMNRQGETPDFIPLSGFFLELPTSIENGKCLFGIEDGSFKQGSLDEHDEAFIYQSSSSEHIFGGAVSGQGGGKQTKPDTIGWADLSGNRGGLAAGVRWFWQLHPKAIELTKDGLIRVCLYPQRHNKPLNIYTGVARTHEIMLAFHSGNGKPENLAGIFAGLQKPLRPFAPPKWYCRDTQCLGDYCESGGVELYGDFSDAVKTFDEAFESANRRSEKARDKRVIKGVETDSYGFLNYGDGVHWVWTEGVDKPENISWAGNYYGYPHMMCVQFIRTGNAEYFDNFEAHALHVADVHTVHYAEREEIIGGCRYCPPTDHVRIDPKNSGDYKTAQVYVSNLFNHHKISGVIERWYFLRDHRCRDVANMVLDYCYRWKYADNDYGQPRGPGMIMVFCYEAYMLTGDKKWIPRAANVLRVHKGRELRLSFQAGIFLEGMRRYYEISGDEEAYNYIRESVDRMIDMDKKGGVDAQAYSFMYLKTGERKYLDAALKSLPQNGKFEHRWKNYALAMRNAAMCIGDLYQAAQSSGDR